MKKLVLLYFILALNSVVGQTTKNPLNYSYRNLGNGPYIDKYSNGQIRLKFTKINGNIDGEYIAYFKNGQLKEFDFFDNGRFNGVNFTLDENGDTLVVEKYCHDTLVFYRERAYYKNRVCKRFQEAVFFEKGTANNFSGAKDRLLANSIVYDVNTLLESSKVSISYKKYYESGVLKSEGEGINNKGKYDGPWKEYYENNTIASVSMYLNGQLNGEFIAYNSDGSIKKKTIYDKGIIVK